MDCSRHGTSSVIKFIKLDPQCVNNITNNVLVKIKLAY